MWDFSSARRRFVAVGEAVVLGGRGIFGIWGGDDGKKDGWMEGECG